MTINLYNIKMKLLILFLMTFILFFNVAVTEAKKISFGCDDKFNNELQTALKEKHIYFKHEPNSYFTIDKKNAKSFVSIALGINDKIFGSSNTPILYEDVDKDRFGYINDDGKIVIEPKYIIAERFNRYNIAVVADEKEWKYIDTKGKTIPIKPFIYDNGPDYFEEGLSRYVENGLIGFIDEKCQIVIKAQYEFVTPFKNGYASFCVGYAPMKSGEHFIMAGEGWGAINKKGKVVIEAIYDDPIIFEKNKAKVTLKGKSFYIDQFGNK